MALQLVVSNKGKNQLLHNGYLYSEEKDLSGGGKAWKCTEYVKSRCTARVHTDCENSMVTKEINEHTHAADAAKVQAKRKVNELKERARDTQETPHEIVAAVAAGKSIR